MACLLGTYYSYDSPIVVGSQLYQNQTPPLIPAVRGFYSTSVLGVGTDSVYETDFQGIVIDVKLSNPCATDPTCQPPVGTLLYYYANSYTCGFCGTPNQTNIEVAVRAPGTLTAGLFYTEVGVSPFSLVFEIVSTTWHTATQTTQRIMDSTTGTSTCLAACP